jgi:hypothetical protein
MLETSRSMSAGDAGETEAARRNGALAQKAPQSVTVAAFGLERRAGWSVPRKAARPINLERRARFARFDVV